MSAAQLDEQQVDGEPVTLLSATDDAEAERVFRELAQAGGWSAVKAGVADTRKIEVFGDWHPFGALQGRLLTQAQAEELVAG